MPPYRYHSDTGTFSAALRVVGAAALFAALVGGYLLLPPLSYPSNDVSVPNGATAREVADALADAGVIRSGAAFSALIALTGSADELAAGRYRPSYGESSLDWLRRLREADTGIPMVTVTIPEGFARRRMAEAFSAALPNFDAARFLEQTEGEEGYLFPDTYRFDEGADDKTVAAALRQNFERRVAPIRDALTGSDRSFEDVVNMASIVEREATADSRAIVAGILWERLAEGMALQVDAPFIYSIGRGTADLTKADLASDDPYNTYRNKGLPPTPICSPGLDALWAAADPEETKYRYFLTGKDGEMHYATTFEGHKQNRAKYLD